MLTPLPSAKWDYDKAAHLLNRAAFGGTPEEIEALRKKGIYRAVEELVSPSNDSLGVAPPAWAHPQNIRDIRMAIREAKNEPMEQREKRRGFRMMEGANILDLRGWWLQRMATTPAPFLEKMTLFWHGHFATSAEKVKDGYWLWKQNETLRRGALGNFPSLTKAISRDPAMMIYLDLQQNHKEKPNENWARELMELFTLGIGNYTEQDVKESARAFTGYRIDMTTQQFRYAPFQFDSRPKTFLGQTGNWNGDEILDIITRQPACAKFIARKLWRFFAEDQPSEQMVAAVAERLRAHNLEMRPVLREIFSSAEFYSDRAMGNQIKSPVQFLVQTTKLLGTELPPPQIAQNAMRQMGQILFAPPNVKGWDGGKAWISTSTLLFRYNFTNYLINGDAMRPGAPGKKNGGDVAFRPRVMNNTPIPPRAPIDLAKLIPDELRAQPNELIAQLCKRLSLPPNETKTFASYLESRAPDTSDETMRGLLHLMMSTPQFQLA
ncbi:MAG: DUF1800 domain-containing protein [Verrucomicrobiota bacterium]|nr:DUF1800 domain-containing protein [Verrucomicrobiota bacterium]